VKKVLTILVLSLSCQLAMAQSSDFLQCPMVSEIQITAHPDNPDWQKFTYYSELLKNGSRASNLSLEGYGPVDYVDRFSGADFTDGELICHYENSKNDILLWNDNYQSAYHDCHFAKGDPYYCDAHDTQDCQIKCSPIENGN